MKIQVVPQINIPGATIRTKKDGNGGAGQNAYENQFGRSQDDAKKDESEPKQPPLKMVADEGDRFSDVLDAAYPPAENYEESMISELSGRGPGLRVKVKDGGKAIVRQLSGDDFLQLRQVTQRAK